MASTNSLISSLASACPDKAALERRIIQFGLGVLSSVQHDQMTPAQAGREFFHVDNYLQIKRRRLHRDVIEFFEWGMELEDVAALASNGLPETYNSMRALASKVLGRGSAKAGRAKEVAPRRKSA